MIAEIEFSYFSKKFTTEIPSTDQPVSRWDFWDYRVSNNQSVVKSNAYPPDVVPAIRYVYPHGQVWPK